jgi:hypothetical protein
MILFWTNGGINFGTPSIQKLQVRAPSVPLPEGNKKQQRAQNQFYGGWPRRQA